MYRKCGILKTSCIFALQAQLPFPVVFGESAVGVEF